MKVQRVQVLALHAKTRSEADSNNSDDSGDSFPVHVTLQYVM